MGEDRSGESGLMRVYAYHCSRCNYLWFPKDYDFHLMDREAIFELEPPKVPGVNRKLDEFPYQKNS